MTAIDAMSTVVLPTSGGMLRDFPSRASVKSADDAIWQHYDRHTLIYDAVYLADANLVRLYLPRALNFGPFVLASSFRIDGEALRPCRHRVFRRFETLDFKASSRSPSALSICLREGAEHEVSINWATPEFFRDRRVIYTLLKDEPLEWIQDWLLFHNRIHSADAVLIADNGSKTYSSCDLLEAVTAVPGYRNARVLSVPLPWGPRGQGEGVDDGKYLQTTLLNLTRDRYFGSASGVLNLDVDELLMRRSQQSVFDRAGRWGLVTFPGEWRYPAGEGPAVRHKHHRYLNPSDKPCATKYCYLPSSRLGRFCLSVHGLERLSRKLFSGKRHFLFLHCRNISTSWKYHRARAADSAMVLDSASSAVLDAVFAAASANG